ncbi:hypothetical protein BDR06DRAFT_1013621 [Suillus hirtellus]|nr:hypothetical protein BDR06DRAFT_1013621 [Suillus hirtellus]
MAGTGYKLRIHIGKAIKARSKAITSALNEYNDLAPLMTPPAPCLEWNDTVHYGLLSEFELLKHSHSQQDILCKPWTVPGNREVAAKYLKLKHAYEELQRLNDTFLAAHVERFGLIDSMLAQEVEELRMRQHHINSVHIARLDTIEAIPGFSGSPGHGIRQGSGTPSTGVILTHVDAAHEDEDEELDDIAADDAWNEDMTHLADVLEGITLD